MQNEAVRNRADHDWQRTGEWFALSGLVLVLLMQAIAGQWFPPPVSVSQYGVGPYGWVFSLAVLSLALAPTLLVRALPDPSRLSRALLWTGLAGCVVMAVIRTDPDGAQQSWNARVHMVGSIVTLTFLPLGMVAALWRLGGRWRWWAVGQTAVFAATMTLLVLAAYGHDTAGLGSHRSWALWQAVGLTVCIVLIATLTLGVRAALGPRMSDHTSLARLRSGDDS